MSMDVDDFTLVVALAAGGGGCSLDSSPGKNWVENAGGLPDYICRIAKAVMKSGKSKSSAIAIAVSRVKKWAAGGSDVDADTRAKAAKAVAQWEKLKGKNKAKKVSLSQTNSGETFVCLSNIASFNTDMVRNAYDTQERAARQAHYKATGETSSEAMPYSYVKELWTDFVIVRYEDADSLARIPYEVSGDSVSFGEPERVVVEYRTVENSGSLSDAEAKYIKDLLG